MNIWKNVCVLCGKVIWGDDRGQGWVKLGEGDAI